MENPETYNQLCCSKEETRSYRDAYIIEMRPNDLRMSSTAETENDRLET